MSKCLSISAPWADIIVHGGKRIENRTWKTAYRGWIVLHAAKSRDRSDYAKYCAEDFARSRSTPTVWSSGALIGRCRVLEMMDEASALKAYPDQAKYISGPVCWVLTDVLALPKPIPFRGMQGLFNVPEEVC